MNRLRTDTCNCFSFLCSICRRGHGEGFKLAGDGLARALRQYPMNYASMFNEEVCLLALTRWIGRQVFCDPIAALPCFDALLQHMLVTYGEYTRICSRFFPLLYRLRVLLEQASGVVGFHDACVLALPLYRVARPYMLLLPTLTAYHFSTAHQKPVAVDAELSLESISGTKDKALVLDSFFVIIKFEGSSFVTWSDMVASSDYAHLVPLLAAPQRDAEHLAANRWPQPLVIHALEGSANARALSTILQRYSSVPSEVAEEDLPLSPQWEASMSEANFRDMVKGAIRKGELSRLLALLRLPTVLNQAILKFL